MACQKRKFQATLVLGTWIYKMDQTPGKLVDVHQLGFGRLTQHQLNKLLCRIVQVPDILHYKVLDVGTAQKVVDLVLAAGASIGNRSDDSDQTPLEAAVSAGQMVMARYLLSAGAVFDIENDNCMVNVLEKGSRDMLELLRAHGVQFPPIDELVDYVSDYVKLGQVEILKDLVRHGVNLHQILLYQSEILPASHMSNTLQRQMWYSESAAARLSVPGRSSKGTVKSLQQKVTKYQESLSASMKAVKFLIPHWIPLPSLKILKFLAQRGSFISAARFYHELVNSGVTVELPNDNIVVMNDAKTSACTFPALGARTLMEMINRSRSQCGLYQPFMQTISTVATVKACFVPQLRHLAVDRVRCLLIGALRRDLAGALSQLKMQLPNNLPENLISYITMEDLIHRMEKDMIRSL